MKSNRVLTSIGFATFAGLFVGAAVLCHRAQPEEHKITESEALAVVRRFCRDPKLKWVPTEGWEYEFKSGEAKRAQVDVITGELNEYSDWEVEMRAKEKPRLTIDQAYKVFVVSLRERGVSVPKGMRLTRAGVRKAPGIHYWFQWGQFVADVELGYSNIDVWVSATDGEVSHYLRLFDTIELKELEPKISRQEAVHLAKRASPLKEPQRVEDVHLVIARDLHPPEETPEHMAMKPGKQLLTWMVTLRGQYLLPHQLPELPPGMKPVVQDHRLWLLINALDGKVVQGFLERPKDNDLQAVERLRKIPLPTE